MDQPLIVAAVVAVFLLTRGPTAPGASAMPLAAGDRIIAQRVTGNPIDDTQPGRYRDLAITGRAGQDRRALIAAEVATMRDHGWILDRSTKSVQVKPGTLLFRDVRVPVNAPGALVQLDGAHHTILASLETTRTVEGADDFDLPPFRARINRALRQGRPLLR